MFTRRALVLGGGAVAAEMARDLSGERDLDVARLELPASDGELAAALRECQVVLSAVPRDRGVAVLRAAFEARRLCADANTDADAAATLDAFARAHDLAACLGCDTPGLTRAVLAARGGADVALRWSANGSSGPALDARIAALTATAMARRLLTGDFRGHWGLWAPARWGARVGMVHGILEDLRGRGIGLRIEPR